MTQRIIYTNHSICRTILLLLMLWAVATPHAAAIPWTVVVPPQGPVPRPYPVMQSPSEAAAYTEVLNVMAPPKQTLLLPGVYAGGCCLPSVPLPVQPTAAWPARYTSPVVEHDDATRWVECLNAQNAARLSRLFENAGAPSNVMGLAPATSDPCSQFNPEPMGWTPGWNLPDPRPAYIVREGHVLITIPDWGGPR